MDDRYRAPAHSISEPTPRRRWLLVAAIVLIALSASCGGCLVVGRQASAEGGEYTTQTIVALARSWDADELLQRASPEFLRAMPPEKLRSFVAFVGGRLGALRRCQDVQNGPWQVFFGSGGLQTLTAHYSDCEFARGPGRVTLQLVRRSGNWEIVSANFNSDLLIEGISRP